MQRRDLLVGVATSLAVTSVGCSAPDAAGDAQGECPDSPRLQVDDRWLEPGERTMLRVDAEGVTSLNAGGPGMSSDLTFEYENATIDPEPSVVWTSRPPTWSFDGCQSVAVELPVRVATDAESGTRRYEVTATESSAEGSRPTVNETYDVTITAAAEKDD